MKKLIVLCALCTFAAMPSMAQSRQNSNAANQYRDRVSGGGRAATLNNFNKPQGAFVMVELGSGVGIGDWGAARASASVIGGYRVLPQFAVGAGVGFEYFDVVKETSAPVFLHLRSDLIDGAVSPYIAFNAGYNIALDDGFFGGLLLEPEIGVGFNVVGGHRATVGLSYKTNRVQYYYIGHDDVKFKDWGDALKLKVGFSF